MHRRRLDGEEKERRARDSTDACALTDSQAAVGTSSPTPSLLSLCTITTATPSGQLCRQRRIPRCGALCPARVREWRPRASAAARRGRTCTRTHAHARTRWWVDAHAPLTASSGARRRKRARASTIHPRASSQQQTCGATGNPGRPSHHRASPFQCRTHAHARHCSQAPNCTAS